MAKKKKKKKRKISSVVLSTFKTGVFLLLILVTVYVLVTYVFRRTIVHNVSMQDTLFDGDNIIMDELSYNIGDPKRFDIICFKSYKEKDLLIKRIIGLPGETVSIVDGNIYIDGEQIKDVKGLEEIDSGGVASSGVKLSDDEYFVIGDNRDESTDSRSNEVGNIRRKDIMGKAAFVFWPANHIKIIK
ncbi:MAG: signal peptidase I [Lachnospiraceae bacterium]|nr:signal peptidase I [Lachnospiraceae bacterium]